MKHDVQEQGLEMEACRSWTQHIVAYFLAVHVRELAVAVVKPGPPATFRLVKRMGQFCF